MRNRPSATESARPAARVLLVGSMASGKTSVGRAASTLLGWHFADIDDAIEEEFGMTICEIFAHHGEATFRVAEARLTASALERLHAVISPGGGWAAQEMSRLSSIPPGTVGVWLRTKPETALERIQRSINHRPLLGGSDPLKTLTDLARRRLPYYGQAQHVIDTDESTVPELAKKVVSLVENPTYEDQGALGHGATEEPMTMIPMLDAELRPRVAPPGKAARPRPTSQSSPSSPSRPTGCNRRPK